MSSTSYLSLSSDLPLTYGQRLRRIMQDNRLSASDLCRKMGIHSPTQLTRILNDEVSPTIITKFHRQFMLIFDWLISPAEIRALSTSLQYSCMGQDAFLTRRAIYRMLFAPQEVSAETVSLRPAKDPFWETSAASTLSDLITHSSVYEKIDLLVLGSAFDRLLPLFATLLETGYPLHRLTIRHTFIMEENAAKLTSQVSALMPFLNTDAYIGAYCTESSAHAARFLRQNPIAVVRSVAQDGAVFTTLFLSPQEDGLPVCRLPGDELYAFYERMLSAYQEQLRPVKSVYPHPKTVESLLTMCQRDLFMEQNHACCFVRLDLCFHALPTEVVLAAVDQGARMGISNENPLLQELVRVHEARYQNLFTKKAPTLFILSSCMLLDFAKTGHMSDHLYAMRDFTPEERCAVLQGFLDALSKNDALLLHLIKEDGPQPVGCFCAYEDLGMQVSSSHTTYNPADSHSEVFVGVPALAQSFMSYCRNTLIPESCMTQEESIAWLTNLTQDIKAGTLS